ncbi:MAG: hypothetical protein ACI87E_002589 [Mariniblastus sp.]|jgi:hypothetical protein
MQYSVASGVTLAIVIVQALQKRRESVEICEASDIKRSDFWFARILCRAPFVSASAGVDIGLTGIRS